MIKQFEKMSIGTVALLQSALLTAYIFLVGNFMVNGNRWFGPMNDTRILGPMLFLTLFIVSAIISGLIVLGFPFYVFWIKKDWEKALKILGSTVGFLVLYFIFYLTIVIAISH